MYKRQGYHQEAAMFYRFAKNVQCPDGGWQQRYWMNGDWGSSWGRQNDQTGAVLWGYFHHYQATQDKNFLKEIWSSTLAGAEHLRRHVFQKNNLPLPGICLLYTSVLAIRAALSALVAKPLGLKRC